MCLTLVTEQSGIAGLALTPAFDFVTETVCTIAALILAFLTKSTLFAPVQNKTGKRPDKCKQNIIIFIK